MARVTCCARRGDPWSLYREQLQPTRVTELAKAAEGSLLETDERAR